MKVGDYVRTKNGLIRKVVEIDKLIYIDKDYISDESEYHDSLIEEDVIKASSNIIDLIEVGDILTYKDGSIAKIQEINGKYYLLKDYGGEQYYEKNEWVFNDFVSIVTKEQFEEMSYKVK